MQRIQRVQWLEGGGEEEEKNSAFDVDLRWLIYFKIIVHYLCIVKLIFHHSNRRVALVLFLAGPYKKANHVDGSYHGKTIRMYPSPY